MKAFPKAIFLMLALSASADSVKWKNDVWALSESSEPKTSDLLHEAKKDDKKKERKASSSKSSKDSDSTSRASSKSSKDSDSTSRASSKSSKDSSSSSTSRSSSKSSKDSSSSRDGRKCVDDEQPRPTHSSKGRFRFKLVRSNARCVDKNRNLYEYGQFDKVKKFSECAEACVNDVRTSLLENFRGYDYDCYSRKCRCLYDKGTLDSRNSGRFDRTSRSEKGKGSVDGAEKRNDFYCAKLAGSDLFGDYMDGSSEGYDHKDDFQAQVRRAVRGGYKN